ncbi:MAG: hypothetical protein ACI867_001119 [Glaciecola sp.]
MALIPEPPQRLDKRELDRFLSARRRLAMRGNVTLLDVPVTACFRLRPLGDCLATVVTADGGADVDAFVQVDADLHVVQPSDVARFLQGCPPDTLVSLRGHSLGDGHLTELPRQGTLERLMLTGSSVTTSGLAPSIGDLLTVLQVESPNLDDDLVEVLLNAHLDMAMLEVTGMSTDGISRLIVTCGIHHLVLTGITARQARHLRPLRASGVDRLTIVAGEPLDEIEIDGLDRALGPSVGNLRIDATVVRPVATAT